MVAGGYLDSWLSATADRETPGPEVEVVERDGEVPRVPTGRLESEPERKEGANAHQGQDLEADRGRLLRQLADSGVAGCEHRDAVPAIDRVVSLGVRPDEVGVEAATPVLQYRRGSARRHPEMREKMEGLFRICLLWE